MQAPTPPGFESKSASSLVLGTSEELGRFLLFSESSATNPSSALYLYEKSTAVSIPVNMVAEAFSSVPPSLIVTGPNGPEFVPEAPVLDLLRKPSPWHDEELFLDTIAKNFLVTGEAPVVALGNIDRPPLELVPLSPRSLSPDPQLTSDAPKSWRVTGNTLSGVYEADVRGRRARYTDGRLRELHVIRTFSTRNNALLRGQSPLVPAAREARSHILGTEHNVSLLEHGGRVSLVFHFDANLSRDEFEETKRRIMEQYGGATRAGSIGVTSGSGMNIKEFGVPPKDMDFAGLHKLAQQSVALSYRVPLPLISDERQTLSNYREGKIALYDDAVLPLARRLLGSLSRFLLPKFGMDPAKARLVINPDDVPALVSRRNDELLKRSRLGVETDNEMRALLGREPYEGGDVVFKPASMLPVGSDLFTADNPERPEPGAEDSAT